MWSVIYKLFISFLKVGTFAFGGAYSLLPIIENEVVTKHAWLTNPEFMKVLGMVEIVPGAISIKYATYVGYKAAGIPGVIAANVGNLVSPIIIMLFMYKFYDTFSQNKYVQKAFMGLQFLIMGMILAIVVKYVQNQFADYKQIIFLILGFSLMLFLKLSPIYIILIGILLAMVIF
ncbi:MAG: chromate transporter [Ignavibacteria bacterium GWF2_33_9]|nr:MAG: chromate transporter [Ignavibacteria bacterium GWF2_33_9]